MLVSGFMKTVISTNQTALSFDYSRHEAEYKVGYSSLARACWPWENCLELL